MSIAPQGDYLYVIVSSRNLGDGLLVVNTLNNTAEDFRIMGPPDCEGHCRSYAAQALQSIEQTRGCQ